MKNNDSENLKVKYKHFDLQTLVSYGVLELAKDGKPICPHCGNGSHDDGTGAEFNLLDDAYILRCFGCGFAKDVFGVIGEINGLDDKTEFPAVMNKAREIFGDTIAQVGKKIEQTALKDEYKIYILNCHKNLAQFVGEKYRGIDCAIYKKFICGYDPAKQRFIIPTSYNHYLERYTGNEKVKSEKKHTGTKEIFAMKLVLNQYKLVFVVEGEFDALSFWQIDYPAISFSGSDISKFQKVLFKQFPHDTKFVILFDNDDTGKKQAVKVADIIQKLGYLVAHTNLTDEYKDANEFLQADSEGFKSRVSELVAEYEDLFKNQALPVVVEEIPAETPQNRSKTFKVGELELTMPDKFYMTKYGVFHKDKNNNWNKFFDVAIYPLELYHLSSGGNSKVRIAVYNKKTNTNTWRKILLERADVAEPKKLLPILANYGLNVHSDNIKYVSKFLVCTIAENEEILAEVTTTNLTGWHDNNTEFVYPNVAGKYELDNGFDYESKFYQCGDEKTWIETFKKFGSKLFSDVAVIGVFGTVLAAPLVKVCSARNLQLALIGKSGLGKSALMKFAFSILGYPDELKNTFNGTENAINELSRFYNDLPIWIDELQSATKKMHENLEKIIYIYENAQSRLRLNKLCNLRDTFNHRGTRLFTAEQYLLKYSAGQGAMARLIQIQISNNTFADEFAQELHETAQDNFGFFGFDWIQYIQQHKQELIEEYKAFQKLIHEKKAGGELNWLPAHIQAVSLILTAYKHFIQFLLNRGHEVLTVSFDDFVNDGLKDLVLAYFADKLPGADETTNAKRALAVLREIIDTHSQQFSRHTEITIENKPQKMFVLAEKTPALGVVLENGDVGYYPTEIQKLLTQDYGFPDGKIIFDQFAQNNWLDTGNNAKRKNQKSVRVNDNQSSWLYVVKFSALKE